MKIHPSQIFKKNISAFLRKTNNLIYDFKCHGLRKALIINFSKLLWRYRRSKEMTFDKKNGLDTSGTSPNYFNNFEHSNKEFAIEYEPIQHDVFRKMLKRVKQKANNSIFIDLGSGKARSLIYASKLSFKKLIGVEFSKELHEIACGNLNHHFDKDIISYELICEDASKYKLPNDNIILFMYNPFNGKVMESVVAEIRLFLENNEHNLTILYRNPVCSHLFENLPNLSLTTKKYEYHVYTKTPITS